MSSFLDNESILASAADFSPSLICSPLDSLMKILMSSLNCLKVSRYVSRSDLYDSFISLRLDLHCSRADCLSDGSALFASTLHWAMTYLDSTPCSSNISLDSCTKFETSWPRLEILAWVIVVSTSSVSTSIPSAKSGSSDSSCANVSWVRYGINPTVNKTTTKANREMDDFDLFNIIIWYFLT